MFFVFPFCKVNNGDILLTNPPLKCSKSREIKPVDYYELKEDIDKEYNALISEKSDITLVTNEFKKYLEFSNGFIQNLDQLYNSAGLYSKQKIISSIFPQNLIYTNEGFLTDKVNKVVVTLSPSSAGYVMNRNGQTAKNNGLSSKVNPTRFELVTASFVGCKMGFSTI
ncbi:MAG: hypothetical protein HRT71_14020 [Flavobacteriales bacterium]|nr:hypothetical protein [Flavobacteriales bacterium]